MAKLTKVLLGGALIPLSVTGAGACPSSAGPTCSTTPWDRGARPARRRRLRHR